MSLQPSDTEKPEPKPATKWPPWRKTMMAGALVLFFNYLAAALIDPDPPRIVGFIALSVGYVLLAVGFGLRMRDRSIG